MKVTFLVGAENNLPQYYCLAHCLKQVFDILFVDLRVGGISKSVQTEGFECEEFIVPSIVAGNNLGLVRRLIDANEFITQYPSDIYIVPYEFHFFYFVTKFAQSLEKKVVHIQHALWGIGKFNSDFYKKADQSVSATARSETRVSLKSRLKRRLFPSKQPASEILELDAKQQEIWATYKSLNDNEKCYPLSADVFLVPNEWYKKQVATERPDFPKNRVVISGILKETVFETKYTRSQLANKFSLTADKKWAVYLFAEFEQFPDRYSMMFSSLQGCQDFIDAFEGRKDAEIIVLVHPSTKRSMAKLKQMTAGKGITTVLTDEHFDVYRQAEVVAGVKSTALLEAAAMGKPVVRQMYVLGGLYDHIQYESDTIYFRSTPNGFKNTVKSFFDEQTEHLHYQNQMKLRKEFFLPLKKAEIHTAFKELVG